MRGKHLRHSLVRHFSLVIRLHYKTTNNCLRHLYCRSIPSSQDVRGSPVLRLIRPLCQWSSPRPIGAYPLWTIWALLLDPILYVLNWYRPALVVYLTPLNGLYFCSRLQ